MAEKRLQALLGHLRPEGCSPAAAEVSGTRAYRYTVSGSGMLSEEQRAAYERDGFLVVPGLVNSTDLQTFADRFRDICTGSAKVRGLTIMKDVSIAKSEFRKDQRAITKIQHFQVNVHTTYMHAVWSHSRVLAPEKMGERRGERRRDGCWVWEGGE